MWCASISKKLKEASIKKLIANYSIIPWHRIAQSTENKAEKLG